jgi:transcriptional regulator with XRE-family HTH domain
LELAKRIGTSGAIIGRYERGEMTPSIEVVKKLADTFEVTLDYLVSKNNLLESLQDKAMLAHWQDINSLSSEDRERILFVIDSLLRDAKTRTAYHVK